MKKIIMALVCATMSLSMMAQPSDKKDNNKQPRMEQGCPMQGQSCDQGCPKEGQMQGCPMMGPQQGRPMMQPMNVGDMAILKKLGVDSTKIKKVKEMKQQNRKAMQDLQEKHNKAKQDLKDDYNKNLRQLLGDDTYIKYLEAKVAQSQYKGNKGMKRQGMRQGRGNRKGQPRMGQPGQRPMGPGMQPGKNAPKKDGAQKSGDKKDKKELKKLKTLKKQNKE